jgi:hypothetical protein
MSKQPNENAVGMIIRRARLALGFILLVGLFVMLYGIVGPISGGAAFAEVVVDGLGLPKERETYNKLSELYADHEYRRGILTLALGLVIAVPAFFGLWSTGLSSGSSNVHHP